MYTELHCHSAYSFDGASEPAELAAAAADLGYEALALTDHDNVCGAMEFAHACTGVGVRPIVGTELTVECGAETAHVTLLVESAAGWANLCRLITEGHAGTRPKEGRSRCHHRFRSSSWSGIRRGWSAFPAAPARGRWRDAGKRVIRAGPRHSPAACSPPSAATASGSSCSGRCGGATGRATAGLPPLRSGWGAVRGQW